MVLETFQELFRAFVDFTVKQAAYGRIILDYLHIIFNNLFYVLLFFAAGISLLYLILTVYALLIKQKTKHYKFDRKKAPFVTIQIPTRNEVIALRCARKCLDFDYPKDRYEILIGDDSNDKAVSNEIDKFAAEHPQVKVARREKNIGFKPGNLNNMLKYTKGDLIVVFDSDFAPENDFLKKIVAPFLHDKEIAAVQARWKFTNTDQNLVTTLASTIVFTFQYIFLPVMKKYDTGFLCGSAECVKKSYLVKFGGWTSGALTEDIEYSLRIHKHGKKIIYLPEVECLNEAPSTLKDLYKQQMRWAYGVISAYSSMQRI